MRTANKNKHIENAVKNKHIFSISRLKQIFTQFLKRYKVCQICLSHNSFEVNYYHECTLDHGQLLTNLYLITKPNIYRERHLNVQYFLICNYYCHIFCCSISNLNYFIEINRNDTLTKIYNHRICFLFFNIDTKTDVVTHWGRGSLT